MIIWAIIKHWFGYHDMTEWAGEKPKKGQSYVELSSAETRKCRLCSYEEKRERPGD